MASTCSTSLVPIPKARAPNAPWVEVWLSPQTIVMPGWVRPELRADDVHDALVGVAHGKQPDPELGAVGGQHLHLAGRDGILDRPVERGGRHVVVHGRHGQVGPAHAAAGQPQPVEGLGRGHLVDQVEVDVQQVGLAVGLADHVALPHLLGEGLRLAS